MQTMNIREAFSRSLKGEQGAVDAMKEFARIGSKDAEAVLLEQINRARLNNPDFSFAAAFASVQTAFPDLHRAYINGNGILPS